MLLLDLSSIVIQSVVDLLHEDSEVKLTENLFRHIALKQILYYKGKFQETPILCADAKHYWRKEIFPYYKQNRKKARKKSNINWPLFFDLFSVVKEELPKYFAWPYIDVYGAEADDVIAVLAKHGKDSKVTIVSSDKDMLQLQTKHGANIVQWSPRMKKFLTLKNTEYSFMTHLLKGDAGDGVPNVLSPDNVLVTEGIRQKQIRKTLIEAAVAADNPEDVLPDDTAREKFRRNQMLIDLGQIPEKLSTEIVGRYVSELQSGRRTRAFAYIKKYRLANLLKDIDEF